MPKRTIEKLLEGGDKRSLGRTSEVVAIVLKKEELFENLYISLFNDNPVVKMRAADSIEKITLEKPELIQKYKKNFLNKVSQMDQQEVQWHVAQIIPRLRLTKLEKEKAIIILEGYLKKSKSNIVRTWSLQSLFDLTKDDYDIKEMKRRLEFYAESADAPSIRARARNLIKDLKVKRKK